MSDFKAHDRAKGPKLAEQQGLGPSGIMRQVETPVLPLLIGRKPLPAPAALPHPGDLEANEGRAAEAAQQAVCQEPTKETIQIARPEVEPPPHRKKIAKSSARDKPPWVKAGMSEAQWFKSQGCVFGQIAKRDLKRRVKDNANS